MIQIKKEDIPHLSVIRLLKLFISRPALIAFALSALATSFLSSPGSARKTVDQARIDLQLKVKNRSQK